MRVAILAAVALPLAAGIHPLLTRYCAGCHNAKTRTASVVLDEPGAVFDLGLWEEVAINLKGARMPPAGAPQPSAPDRAALLGWVDAEIQRKAGGVPGDPGRVTVRRLNRAEYDNTVRDLLGVVVRPAGDFPADDSGYGFDNIGDVLTVPPVLMENYMRAAMRLAAAAIPLGPAPKPALEKYIADVEEQSRRVEEDDPKGYPFVPGAFEVRHLFPVDAEYELVVRVKDRRNTARTEVPVHMYLDGRRVATFTVQDGEYSKGHFSTRQFVAAGEHAIHAEFDKSYVNVEEWNEKLYGKAQFQKERRIFVDGLDVEGPYAWKPRETAAWKNVFVCSQHTADCAATILHRLARRAYRREPTRDEVRKLVGLVELARSKGDGFEAGIQLALQAILVSPNFLFRAEADPVAGPHAVSSVELASRLSYFLWSSMPDDELLEADLAAPEILRGQVRRMLRDPKSSALARDFAGQWLQLRNLEKAQPDPALFPEFTPHLRKSMSRESEMYFDYVVREDRPILEFLDSDYTFLNARLARHYGIEGVKGREMRLARLASRDRGGLMTQASVLTVSSYPTRTSPVLRGLWVLENFLAAPPPPPPAGVPRLDETKVNLDKPLRVQLQQHRSNAGCAVCHNRMDAIGFGLEAFDAIGKARTHDGKFEVDASGELPGGRRFDGPAGLKRVLLEDKDAFARAFTAKLLTYALGRGLERSDKPTVNAIARAAAAKEYRFAAIVEEIVGSAPFRMRRAEGEAK